MALSGANVDGKAFEELRALLRCEARVRWRKATMRPAGFRYTISRLSRSPRMLSFSWQRSSLW